MGATEPTTVTCPVNPCGRVVDAIKRPYTTLMRFGTDPNQVVQVTWSYCQPGAKTLDIFTPFRSREGIKHDIWPLIGEVQFAPRVNLPQDTISPASGQNEPCGDPDVWTKGYQGTIPPNYPLDAYGFPVCCGLLGAPANLGIVAFDPDEEGLTADDDVTYIGADDGPTVLTADD